MEVLDAELVGDGFAFLADLFFEFGPDVLDDLLDPGRMDPAVDDEFLDGQPGRLAPDRIEAREDDRFGRIVDDDVDARSPFPGPGCSGLRGR